MKLFNMVKVDIYKILKSYIFWIAVLTVFILCFTATLYTDETNRKYTIINVLLNFNRDTILQNIDYSAQRVMILGKTSKIFMFITIVTGFPFISVFCDERKSKNMRMIIYRSGKAKYYIGKLISAIVSGGLVVTLGYIMFCIAVSFLFPSINEFPLNMQKNFNEVITYYGKHEFTFLYYKIGSIAIIFSSIIEMFIYGAFAVILTFIFSSFITNKYLLLCIPFTLKYIFDMWINKLQLEIWAKNMEGGVIQKFIVNNCSLEMLMNIFSTNKVIIYIISYIIISIIAEIVFATIMNRRIDYGE